MEEISREMMIISANCWQCGKPMLTALKGDDAGNLDCGPEDFKEEEKQLVEKYGVTLKVVSSKTTEET